MTNMNDNTLSQMTADIVAAVQPETVLLFGSRARGVARADSDVDLLVVERESFGTGRSRRAEIGRIRRALSAYDVAKDILVYSREEVARWRDSLNHVIATAFRDGRVLYAAPGSSSRRMEPTWWAP